MANLTLVHTVISLLGIVSGFFVLAGFLRGRRVSSVTAWFVVTTIATSVTGFLFFPLQPFLPSHVIGVVSLVVLALALLALYVQHLSGPWGSIYVASAMAAFYLNVFVLVVQLFRRVPALHALAPTESEPPLLFAQLAVLIVFAGLTILSVARTRREATFIGA